MILIVRVLFVYWSRFLFKRVRSHGPPVTIHSIARVLKPCQVAHFATAKEMQEAERQLFTPLERHRLLSVVTTVISRWELMLPSAGREVPVLTGFTSKQNADLAISYFSFFSGTKSSKSSSPVDTTETSSMLAIRPSIGERTVSIQSSALSKISPMWPPSFIQVPTSTAG